MQAVAVGLQPYLAEHDPQPGRQLADKVRAAIGESVAVIVLLTPAGYDSPYVHQEIASAIEQGVLVVPLVSPEIAGSDLAMLNGVEWLPFDFSNPTNDAASLTAALHRIASDWVSARKASSGTTNAQSGLFVQVHAELALSPEELLLAGLVVVAVATLIVIAVQQGNGLPPPS